MSDPIARAWVLALEELDNDTVYVGHMMLGTTVPWDHPNPINIPAERWPMICHSMTTFFEHLHGFAPTDLYWSVRSELVYPLEEE